MATKETVRAELVSREFAMLTREEKVKRLVAMGAVLDERHARRFLAIGSGEHPGDERKPSSPA